MNAASEWADTANSPQISCPRCHFTGVIERRRSTAIVRPAFPGARIYRCRRCGLSFLAPVPDQPETVYNEEYFQAYAGAGLVFPTESEQLPPRFVARLREIESLTRPGQLLEIGVGHGAFLNLAKQSGWRTTGVDVSQYVARQVEQRFGIEVFCGTLEGARLPTRSYDAVHMSHVLEHLADPRRTLVEVRRVLRPGGVLAIEVPNELDSLQTRAGHAAGLLRAYPVKSTHLMFFTPRTLAELVVESGFDVKRVNTVRDCTDRRLWRRLAKRVWSRVENPLAMGPLIDLIARPRTADAQPVSESA